MGLCFLCLFGGNTKLFAQSDGETRWKALAMIESGNNDRAVGAVGEISRYQIRPAIWKRYAPPGANWRNQRTAFVVATKVMEERLGAFRESHKRAPTDFEFYVLWNAPGQVRKPTKVVAARAHRFCGLVRREEQQRQIAEFRERKRSMNQTLSEKSESL